MADTNPPGPTKRALHALATERAADHDRPAARVVEEATDALGCVGRTTRFLADDGAERLARAVAAAVRSGDDETVRRGREALATLDAFRTALDGSVSETESATDGPVSGPTRTSTDQRAGSNHFHPALGTVLRDGGKRGGR